MRQIAQKFLFILLAAAFFVQAAPTLCLSAVCSGKTMKMACCAKASPEHQAFQKIPCCKDSAHQGQNDLTASLTKSDSQANDFLSLVASAILNLQLPLMTAFIEPDSHQPPRTSPSSTTVLRI